MRKLIVATLIVALATLGWSVSSFGQKTPGPRGELRIVDKNPRNWAWVTMNVMEHLWEFDKDGRLVPRLATGWRWVDDHTIEAKLRRGVRFHNGEVFDADIVKLNWEENTRLTQPHLTGTYMNFKPGSRLVVIDSTRSGSSSPSRTAPR